MRIDVRNAVRMNEIPNSIAAGIVRTVDGPNVTIHRGASDEDIIWEMFPASGCNPFVNKQVGKTTSGALPSFPTSFEC